MTSKGELPPPTGKGPTRECIVIPHNGSVPHALFYDLTHDNESYLHKRSAEDALSTGALVTFSFSAIGSVKGFDDLYPRLLNLVAEKRTYELTGQGERSGIAKAKRLLNSLHTEMALEGYEEGHVHQENDVSSSTVALFGRYHSPPLTSISSSTESNLRLRVDTSWSRTQHSTRDRRIEDTVSTPLNGGVLSVNGGSVLLVRHR